MNNIPSSLLKGRLGIYDNKPIYNPNQTNFEGVNNQFIRLQQLGGNGQQERMIKDKRRSLDHAVWYSYQAAQIKHIDNVQETPIRALINPNKLKQDYDDKILSVGFEHNFSCGDIFHWVGTNTYWIIYLQDLTELAYFRGDIRKCSYQISWEDEKGRHTTYAAVRGPVETKINFIQKHGISVDVPNHSLSLLLPKNEDTLNYFKRYNKFYLHNDPTCWRIEAIDWVSTPGILEVTAVEYYANEIEDDIEQGIVGGKLDPIIDDDDSEIIGNNFIKIKKKYTYSINTDLQADWYVDSKYPVQLYINPNNSKEISLEWCDNYSGQFILNYGNFQKTIVVESLF